MPGQVNYLIATSVLLVKMKRKELEFKARQRHREEVAAASGDSQAVGRDAKQAAGGTKDVKKER